MAEEKGNEFTPKHKLALRQAGKLVAENDTGYEPRDVALWPESFLYEWLGDCGFEWDGEKWHYWGTA